MVLIAPRLDMGSSKQTDEQIITLTDYVSGHLSQDTMNFLQEICLKNADGLAKIIVRCQQLKMNLKAEEVNRVILSLHKQMMLPNDMIATIKYYLTDKRMNSIANVLNSGASKLESSLVASDQLKSILHVSGHLNLFMISEPEVQFVRSIIIMLLNFQKKEFQFSKLSDMRKRSAEDASKWLRTLLAISDKSALTKFIDLLADRLYLVGNMITGETRNMDLAELFFLFEEAAIQANLPLSHDSNKTLIVDINAMMLTTLVCQKMPHSLFDVMTMQHATHQETIQIVKRYYKKTLIIEQFLELQTFEPYFDEHHTNQRINQDAFLVSLIHHFISAIIHPNNGLDTHMQIIEQLIDHTQKTNQEINERTLMQCFHEATQDEYQDTDIHMSMFKAIEQEAQANHKRMGSLVFIVNKLIVMGFSPRAASMATTGVFQPLIASHAPQTDIKNMKALKLFADSLKPDQRKQLFNELVIFAVAHPHHALGKRLEMANQQQKFSFKRTTREYAAPIFHNLQKSKTAKTTRVHRKQPKYSGTFFVEVPTVKQSADNKRRPHPTFNQ